MIGNHGSLCYENKDLLHFQTQIVASRPVAESAKRSVLLAESYFFPAGGGQPADRGRINRIPVLDVQEKDGLVWHTTAQDPGLGPAECLIDERWRRHYMSQHTGQHILSAALWQLGALATLSVHFGEQTTTIETDAGDIGRDMLMRVEDLANDVIRRNLTVESREIDSREIDAIPLRKKPTVSGRIRVVSVGSFDFSVCCGLHLPRSGELGLITFHGSEKIRGNTRTIWHIGQQAYENNRQHRDIVEELRQALSCSPRDLMPKLLQMQHKMKDLSRQYAAVEALRAAEKVSELVNRFPSVSGKGRTLVGIFTETESLIRQMVTLLLSRPDTIFCIINKGAEQFTWNIGCTKEATLDFDSIAADLLHPLAGKGGGRFPLWKGSVPNAEDAQAFLERFNTLLIEKGGSHGERNKGDKR